MIVANIPDEFNRLLWRHRIKRKDICEIYEIQSCNLSRLLRKPMPTPQLVEILDALGYDVEVHIVPKAKEE